MIKPRYGNGAQSFAWHKPEPSHKIYPYLLRGVAIARPNQVWAMDITYIAMARGFVYFAVVLDCNDDALARHGGA